MLRYILEDAVKTANDNINKSENLPTDLLDLLAYYKKNNELEYNNKITSIANEIKNEKWNDVIPLFDDRIINIINDKLPDDEQMTEADKLTLKNYFTKLVTNYDAPNKNKCLNVLKMNINTISNKLSEIIRINNTAPDALDKKDVIKSFPEDPNGNQTVLAIKTLSDIKHTNVNAFNNYVSDLSNELKSALSNTNKESLTISKKYFVDASLINIIYDKFKKPSPNNPKEFIPSISNDEISSIISDFNLCYNDLNSLVSFQNKINYLCLSLNIKSYATLNLNKINNVALISPAIDKKYNESKYEGDVKLIIDKLNKYKNDKNSFDNEYEKKLKEASYILHDIENIDLNDLDTNEKIAKDVKKILITYKNELDKGEHTHDKETMESVLSQIKTVLEKQKFNFSNTFAYELFDEKIIDLFISITHPEDKNEIKQVNQQLINDIINDFDNIIVDNTQIINTENNTKCIRSAATLYNNVMKTSSLNKKDDTNVNNTEKDEVISTADDALFETYFIPLQENYNKLVNGIVQLCSNKDNKDQKTLENEIYALYNNTRNILDSLPQSDLNYDDYVRKYHANNKKTKRPNIFISNTNSFISNGNLPFFGIDTTQTLDTVKDSKLQLIRKHLINIINDKLNMPIKPNLPEITNAYLAEVTKEIIANSPDNVLLNINDIFNDVINKFDKLNNASNLDLQKLKVSNNDRTEEFNEIVNNIISKDKSKHSNKSKTISSNIKNATDCIEFINYMLANYNEINLNNDDMLTIDDIVETYRDSDNNFVNLQAEDDKLKKEIESQLNPKDESKKPDEETRKELEQKLSDLNKKLKSEAGDIKKLKALSISNEEFDKKFPEILKLYNNNKQKYEDNMNAKLNDIISIDKATDILCKDYDNTDIEQKLNNLNKAINDALINNDIISSGYIPIWAMRLKPKELIKSYLKLLNDETFEVNKSELYNLIINLTNNNKTNEILTDYVTGGDISNEKLKNALIEISSNLEDIDTKDKSYVNNKVKDYIKNLSEKIYNKNNSPKNFTNEKNINKFDRSAFDNLKEKFATKTNALNTEISKINEKFNNLNENDEEFNKLYAELNTNLTSYIKFVQDNNLSSGILNSIIKQFIDNYNNNPLYIMDNGLDSKQYNGIKTLIKNDNIFSEKSQESMKLISNETNEENLKTELDIINNSDNASTTLLTSIFNKYHDVILRSYASETVDSMIFTVADIISKNIENMGINEISKNYFQPLSISAQTSENKKAFGVLVLKTLVNIYGNDYKTICKKLVTIPYIDELVAYCIGELDKNDFARVFEKIGEDETKNVHDNAKESLEQRNFLEVLRDGNWNSIVSSNAKFMSDINNVLDSNSDNDEHDLHNKQTTKVPKERNK